MATDAISNYNNSFVPNETCYLMSNLWILTEERPKASDIATILVKTADKLGFSANMGDIWFDPNFHGDIFSHQFTVMGAKITNIQGIYIKIVSSSSSFVDCLVFHQDEVPKPSQVLNNCIFAIEETKTNTYQSRNTAMGQRSCKFNFLEHYWLNGNQKFTPVMFFTSKQAKSDNDSVAFVNRMLLHLNSGIEFWGKDDANFKKFGNLEEFLNEKNRISSSNNRKNDTPIFVKKVDNVIFIQALLANPNNTRENYTGRIQHDPNMGQVPMIARTIRSLGWTGEIIVTGHQVLQDRISHRGNKLTALADKIGFELQGIKLPKTSFSPKYWNYEFNKEKVASILAQVILENNGLKTIFDNHGGCEKSFFQAPGGLEIPIPKSYSYRGGKIPDLVVVDFKKKIIYSFEGKKQQNAQDGIKEIYGFGLFEKEFLNNYYPGFKLQRGLILNGGTKLIEPTYVKFQLLDSGVIIKNSKEF